jgi:hypothetical protein
LAHARAIEDNWEIALYDNEEHETVRQDESQLEGAEWLTYDGLKK